MPGNSGTVGVAFLPRRLPVGKPDDQFRVPRGYSVEREPAVRIGDCEVRMIRDEEVGPSPVQARSTRQLNPTWPRERPRDGAIGFRERDAKEGITATANDVIVFFGRAEASGITAMDEANIATPVTLYDDDLRIRDLDASRGQIPGFADSRVDSAEKNDSICHGTSLGIDLRAAWIFRSAKLETKTIRARHSVEESGRVGDWAGPRHQAGYATGFRRIERGPSKRWFRRGDVIV